MRLVGFVAYIGVAALALAIATIVIIVTIANIVTLRVVAMPTCLI